MFMMVAIDLHPAGAIVPGVGVVKEKAKAERLNRISSTLVSP